MKKTLIALAVLAASGASMAQVAITGSVTFGYSTKTTPTTTTGGLGNDGSSVNFGITEDLGGGNTLKANIGLDGMTRVNTVGGGDANLSVAGGWGTLAFTLNKGADYLSGSFVDLEDKIFSGLTAAISDAVSYRTPQVIPGLSFSVAHQEAGGNVAFGSGGAGAIPTAQRYNTYSAIYSSGPLSADLGYRTYDSQNAATASKSRVRAKAAYNFGSFTLGAGVVDTTKNDGTETGTNVGLIVPMGAFSLAADYGSLQNTAGVTRSGYGLVGTYSLSKRTSVAAKYFSYLKATTDAVNTTETHMVLSHSF